jgi:altronate dehydratase large subunit
VTASDCFFGYSRADGRVGIRNFLLVLSCTGLTAPTARRIGRVLPWARVIAPPYGSGIFGRDAELRHRLFLGFATHPNVGAVLLIGAKAPEVLDLHSTIRANGTSCTPLILDECGNDAITLTERGIRAALLLGRDLSRQRRSEAHVSSLFLAAECGRSDTSSGIVANPLVGHVVEKIVAQGGSAVAGETVEWCGAEALLEGRARTAEAGSEIRRAVRRRLDLALEAGFDLMGNNPGPTNIAGGLTTLEEKALGAVSKFGSCRIEGVLEHGQAPPASGFWLMDQPWYAPESLSGMVAAGAQLVLFTTGAGNSFVSLLAPTIKLSANPRSCQTLTEQIDFGAENVFLGRSGAIEAREALWDLILETASGTRTFGELFDEGEEVQSRLGESL